MHKHLFQQIDVLYFPLAGGSGAGQGRGGGLGTGAGGGLGSGVLDFLYTIHCFHIQLDVWACASLVK